MNKFTLIAAGCALVGVAFGQGSKREVMDTQDDPPAIVHWARGQAPDFAAGKVGAGKPVSLLTNHGGGILTTVQTKAIFWGSSWAEGNEKIIGIDSFFNGVSGTPYIGTNAEYGGAGTGTIQHFGHVIDPSAAPSGSPSTGVILGEVCKEITNPDRSGNGFYAVYIDKPRGHAGYCAWHSKGSCGGVPVQFAFFFKLDGDSGCDPGGATGQTAAGLAHSQGLAAIANVTGHELSETVTDPHLDAWYDGQGQENADKCAWTFGSTLLTFSEGSTWKIQGNWSNNAYQGSTGYTKGGCIDR